MTPELYRRILAEAAQHQHLLHLFQPFMFGEALLHPQFPALIRTTREYLPRPRIYISTNGALLDGDRAQAILDARIDKLNVDIDGTTASTAEAIRRHVPFSKTRANVERFIELRNRRRAPTRVRLSIIRLPENRTEIDDFVSYWKPRADHVQIVDFNNWLGTFPEKKGIDEEPVIPFDFPCKHPYEELAITWNGHATICCLDFDLRHPVGDVAQRNIRDIWRDRPIRLAREKLEAGDYASMPICRACNAAKFQQKGLWRWLWRFAESKKYPEITGGKTFKE